MKPKVVFISLLFFTCVANAAEFGVNGLGALKQAIDMDLSFFHYSGMIGGSFEGSKVNTYKDSDSNVNLSYTSYGLFYRYVWAQGFFLGPHVMYQNQTSSIQVTRQTKTESISAVSFMIEGGQSFEFYERLKVRLLVGLGVRTQSLYPEALERYLSPSLESSRLLSREGINLQSLDTKVGIYLVYAW